MFVDIPKLLALIVLSSGIVNIISGFWFKSIFRLLLIQNIFPLSLIHFSRTLTIIIGVFFMYLAGGIWQRKERSWKLTTFLVFMSSIFHLIKGFDYEEGIFFLLVFFVLIKFRIYFTVKSARLSNIQGIKNSGIIFALLFIYSFLGFYMLQGNFSNPVNLGNITRDYLFSILGIGKDMLIPLTRHAIWFTESISTMGFIGIGLIFASLFAPYFDSNKTTDEELEIARKLCLEYGSNSTSYLSLMPDKQLFFNSDMTCFIAYRISGNNAVVLGDPIGKHGLESETVSKFIEQMKHGGLTCVFDNISDKTKLIYTNHKMRLVKIGEEAEINILNFDMTLPILKNVRYSFNKSRKLGQVAVFYKLSQIPWSVMHDINSLYNKWISGKKSPHLSFSLNFFPFPVEDQAYVATEWSANNQLLSALSFYPYKKNKGVVLELMLRDIKAPNGTVEALIVESIYYFKNLGYKYLSLSVAPLSNLSEKEKVLEEKALSFVFQNFNNIYKYKSLFSFKAQFNPTWKHKYLAYPNITQIPKVAISMLKVHLKKKEHNFHQ